MKIAEFNYKFLNNILPTGCNLYKWKKVPTSACICCDFPLHDAGHLFLECPNVQTFWNKIDDALQIQINCVDVISY